MTAAAYQRKTAIPALRQPNRGRAATNAVILNSASGFHARKQSHHECLHTVCSGMGLPAVAPMLPLLLCQQDLDFHIARISVKQEVASQMSDNDLLLLTKDHPHSDDCRVQLHALGFMEGHEGSQSLRVKFFLTDDSQAGKPVQLER